jgi:hypothetical protein
MGKVEDKLGQLLVTAHKLIERESYFSALDYLEICEELLEDSPSVEMSVLVQNNSAFCLQKLSRLEECLKSLQACKKLTEDLVQTQTSAAKVKAMKALCAYSAQACALASQLARHEEALAMAKEQVETTKSLITHMKSICQDLRDSSHLSSSGRLQRLMDGGSGLTGRPHDRKDQAVDKALETLNYLVDFVEQRRVLQPPELSYRSPLGVQKFNDWIFNYTIGSIMTVQVQSLWEAKAEVSWDSELAKDALIKVCTLVIVSLFCLGTELRFVHTADGNLTNVSESEGWHRRSIELAISLLPLECPLVEHLKVSYNRNYATLLEELALKTKLKVPSLPPHRLLSKTTLPSPLRSIQSKSRNLPSPLNSNRSKSRTLPTPLRGDLKSRTITPSKSSGVEKQGPVVVSVVGRFESSSYLRGARKKITLEGKRLIRPKLVGQVNEF